MDTPPVPKPRTGVLPQSDPLKRPVPLPRTKVPANNDRVTASDILRSISTASKQLTEDVAAKVSNSAKSANEKIERSIIDGSRFAKGTLEKTITTSRAVRDSVTKSVIEGTRTAGLKLRRVKKPDCPEDGDQRCVSMPVVDVSLFDNIQFHSPLLEQKRYRNEGECLQSNQDVPSLNLNASHLDDLSLFSSNSDSNADTVSNFSHDSRESEQNISSLTLENEQLTYDTPKSSRANSIVSVRSTPDVPERRKKRESNLEFMRQNSLYENWTLPQQPKMESGRRPSKSTIFEFDPLNASTATNRYEGMSNELLLLESFLIGDTYGTIVTTDSGEDCFEDFGESDYFNPPTPPERTDSLLTEDAESKPQTLPVDKDRNSNWFITETDVKPVTEDETKSGNSVMQRFSHMLKLDNVLNKSFKQNTQPQKVEQVERPPVNRLPVPYFSGTLTRIVSGVVEDLFKNSQTRYCVLSDQKLMCYSDPTNSVLKEAYTLDSIYSLQIVLPLSSSTTSNSYCFELSVASSGRGAPRKVLFSCASAPERRNWAQKFAEHLACGFPTKYTAEFTRCGWCYLKEGVTGQWGGAWVMLIRRVLVYGGGGADAALSVVDLRKTRCVVTQEPDEENKQACGVEGNNLLLDCPRATLYLRFPHERELKGWRYMVKLAAQNNGAHIHHQQLTKEDVPAIVDKCLSFIYAHGSLTEGIYRRAGSSSVLSELLGRFRRDAWSVQLAPGQHSEHDVAGVLKRFFRDLPEPLLPQHEHHALVNALMIQDETARHAEFRRIMTSLPLVARNTSRKLFAHLHFIASMAHANKMGAENLASVWAPTIMPAALTSNTLQTAWSSKEVYVVRELIASFESVWEPTEAERRREAAVRKILVRVLSNSAPTAPMPAGDLRAWVYIHDRNTCHQIALTPSKTSADVCIELCEKASMESHQLMLEEVVCGGAMRRVVHLDEVVLDVVLRWGYWDDDDRKDNYLLIRENRLLHEMEGVRGATSMVCGELRLATEGARAFKLHMFEFQNAKLSCFKDKQGSQKIEEWHIKDILWYVGHEPRRNPQSRWAITFIPRNNKPKRSKDRPWFGATIAGAVTEDQLKWTAAMTFAEHATILPTPRLVIT
ncbi:arf-GAP with Rho-GAP domain, ANK repeat and PH domain-containing protein 2 isoform X2 [Pectinophora gossypiella]|uniref:arf-GAP with Rho-GAP domain, ANK repeat and PH domain-containing protein 2 isoform X2 n=1 Tax=Pectinophora gossypiella TaxID=13191 RepID=UPI00214DF915|nr:arf-GAP with Rho-GAP domain, ANK repeat and PH domain-containing protein 2 isoform X2 [Pectinophora gossypiella]